MPLGTSTRATLRLGAILLLVAACAGVWELLALQSPGTPLYIATLPGPITGLREIGTNAGVLLLSLGALMAWVRPTPEPRALIGLLHVGAVLALGAQCYAALHGMHGVQLNDLRRDALPLFVAKYAGLLVFMLGFFALTRRLFLQRAVRHEETERPPAGAPGDPPT